MKFSALLSLLSEGEVLSPYPEAEVMGVTCDSRKVGPGYIFVAIPGALTDGHLYVNQAIERGARAVVVEQIQALDGVCQVRVPWARRALAELSRAFYGYPDRDLYMMGVTATNGKTTTTSMVHHILKREGVPASVIGSVAYSFGDEKVPSLLTTPESSDLHAMFKRQLEEGIRAVAMEVSSIAVAQCRVYGIEYDAVAFLNITPDHMPDHGSFEAYYEAKAGLIRGAGPGVPVILNRDEEPVIRLAGETKGQVVTLGIGEGADLAAQNLKLPGGIPHFDLVVRSPLKIGRGEVMPGSWPVTLRVAGRHSVYNALAAIAITLSYGVDLEKAIAHLATFPGVERRLQILYNREFIILDDHISDEDNTRKMLEALEVMGEGKKVHIIYAVRGNRGVEVNREVAGQFALFKDRVNWGTFVVTTSEDVAKKRDVVHKEEFEAVMEDLTAAGYDITYVAGLEDSIQKLLPQVREGEIFVLAGSHNMDRGGRLALNLLASMKEPEERGSILEILDDRMMG